MNLDLSWSHHLKTDARTLVTEVRSEVKSHMDLISSHMSKLDNVIRALNEGNRVLGNTFCQKCLDAVKSKRIEMHERNKTSHKKQKLMKLSPECQQIVNEITNVSMKLERSHSENPSNEENCTQENSCQQEMVEMQKLHTEKIMNIQEEIVEMENKYKKEVKDKEAVVRDLRIQLGKMTFEKKICKEDNDQMSKRLMSYLELNKNHKRLKEDLDRKECIINKLKRDLELKEEDNRRYRRSSSSILTRSFIGNRYNELTSLKEVLIFKDAEVQTSMTERENLKTERYELLQQNRNLQEENNSLKKTTESRDEELRSSRRENENLKSERDELLQRNRNLQEETNSLKETIALRVEELQTSKRENENLKSERDELLQRNRNPQKEKNVLKETTDSTCEELRRSLEDNETLKSEQKELTERQQQEKRTSKEKLDSSCEELHRSRGDNDTLTLEQIELIGSLQEEKRSLKEKLGKHADKSYPEEKEEDEKEISQQRAEIQILQDQACILHKKNAELSSTMENLQRDVTWLIERLERTQGDLDKLKKQNEETVRDISHLQTEKQTLHGQTCSLNKANKVLSTTMEGLQRDIKQLAEESVKKDEEINKLKLSLMDYRRLEKKLLVMRLMCSKQSELDKGIMDMVTKELRRLLEERIDSNSIEFAIVHCETSTDISYGPLFVLCLNMSREDRYFRDALEKTKGGTDVYVLVLHNTNKELTPTRFCVTGSELRQQGKVIELAFKNDIGLYDCNLNNEGIENIVSVLKKF